jgi:hypothetical protein
MKHTAVSTYSLLLAACAVALFAIFAMMPLRASALEVSTQTQQILPPGQNTCAPVQVSNFTPFVYNGSLNSFEFTVSDSSYVAVVGSVGNASIPLRYMTRLPADNGGVRIHVDVDNTSVAGSVPVTITLLSARTGSPVCAAVVSTNLGNSPSSSTGPSVPSYTPSKSTGSVSKPTPVAVTPAPVVPNNPVPGAGQGSQVTGTASKTPVVTGSLGNALKNLCVSEASAFRLWLILLVLYALVVGGLLWLEFPLSWNWAKTPERVATVILVLLVLLLGFWYISSACRAALWMPLLAFLIAILGLLAAFWNHPRVTQLLLTEETKTTVIVTPPPAKK